MTAFVIRKSLFIKLSSLLVLMLIGACANETYAPVVDAWHDPGAMKSRYRVQKDDTVYSVAWSFDLDYRDLVAANHLTPPYTLKPGQSLTMVVSSQKPVEKKNDDELQATTFAAANWCPGKNNTFQEVKMAASSRREIKQEMPLALNHLEEPRFTEDINLPQIELNASNFNGSEKKQTLSMASNENIVELPKKTVVINQDKILGQVNSGRWLWPARGRILKEFSLETGGSKGIDIAGNLNDPVRAVAPGKVVYSGSGLRGYGNLVIIKHSDNYLSAYAYNKKLLVKEGDVVKAGAEIGKMGQNDAGNVLLHFEIRRNGKPVNPLLYL